MSSPAPSSPASPPPSVPEATAAYRAQYRRTVLPARYSGPGHIALVLLLAGGGVAACAAYALRHGRWSDLWIVPVTLVVSNVVEYLAHRGPMHHRVRGLHALHARHSGRHHRFFVDSAMTFESTRDFHAVLFPPVLLVFFGGIAAALGALVALVLPVAVAAGFVATALAYYLLYECLHFVYHLPADAPVARWPGVRWLATLHRLHHDPRRMQERNFNLVFPLCDAVAGTYDGGPGRSSPPARIDDTASKERLR
jgi:general stress protein CsbA